ncbi:MAG: glycosyltransferase family 61 protein [Bacteroidota bacterium]
MTKADLKIYQFNRLIILKTLLVIYPAAARKVSLFDNLTKWHKRRIFKYRFLSTIKNIPSFNIDRSDNKVIIFNIYSTGYYHFIAESLVKIALHYDHLKDKIILLPNNTPQFIKDAFQYLNIKNCETIRSTIFLNKVEMIENPLLGEFHPEHLALVRKNFRNFRPADIQGIKIYISRKKARSRKIAEETELEQKLQALGYKILCTEGMTFMEQVELFSNASSLISAHGAGLANMIFMQEGSEVIELMPIITPVDKYDTNFCYRNMATALKFNYTTIFCDKVDKSIIFDRCDLHVDVEKIILSL